MKGVGTFLSLVFFFFTTIKSALLESLVDHAEAYATPYGYFIKIEDGNEAIFQVCEMYCNISLGATMGSIYNSIENDALISTFNQHFQDVSILTVGIGLEYFNGSFEWKDDTPTDYLNWDTNSGEPEVTNGSCVVADFTTGLWKMVSCEAGIRHFYCNKYDRRYSNNFVVATVLDTAMNNSDAKKYCTDLYGTSLSIIRSSEEQQELNELTQEEASVWIGLAGDGVGGEAYLWPNGKSPSDYGYTNWASGQTSDPDNVNCVVNTDDGWTANACSIERFTLSCILWTPTSSPTMSPVIPPTNAPTLMPTSLNPTLMPTSQPTTGSPTTASPTTGSPTTGSPTVNPTRPPTTHHPTPAPTETPTKTPTKAPNTHQPTSTPTQFFDMSTTGEAKGDDSEGFQWYYILIIVLGTLACVAIILFFLFTNQRKNKEERYAIRDNQAVAMANTTTVTTTVATGYSANNGEQNY